MLDGFTSCYFTKLNSDILRRGYIALPVFRKLHTGFESLIKPALLSVLKQVQLNCEFTKQPR